MLKKWILKAIVQKTISLLPGKHRINFFFQKHVTRGVRLSDEYFEDRLGHAAKHLFFFKKWAKTPLRRTLELGTGWYPVVPTALFLSGAEAVFSIDIDGLCNAERLRTTLLKFSEAQKSGLLKSFLPSILPERWAVLEAVLADPALDFEAMQRKMSMHLTVGDARVWKDKHGKNFDLIHSNNTFEHVYPSILEGILIQFQAILNKNGGIQCHFIDLSDHFAHLDRTITIYNFLRFTEAEWRWIDNSVQPQNRLRWPAYRAMYEKIGLEIMDESVRPGDLEALKSVRRAAPFANFSEAEAAISHGYLISK